MTNPEALNYFRRRLELEQCGKSTTQRKAFESAIEALEKQATSDYASEWIPVSERLPDRNGTYLITVSSYDETASIEYITVDHGNCNGGFLHFETKKNPKAKSGKVVTAWMPLPEPYIEG